MTTINVIGAGAYGTALASAAQEKSKHVKVWSYDINSDFIVKERHYYSRRLKSTFLPPEVEVSNNLEQVAYADILLLAVPAQAMRSVAENLKDILSPDTYLVICSKGIENSTAKFMTEVLEEILPGQPTAVLSGPSFAIELAQRKPTGVTIAAEELTTAQWLCQSIGSSFFRTYASDDRIGVQIGGAVKNVIAIAAGILHGKAMGENARALLVTRGLAEMIRLGCALGAKSETFHGLSGMGDLWLTCVSGISRNWTFGYQLASGGDVKQILAEATHAIEGVKTTQAVMTLAQEHRVRMPICEAIDAVINEEADLEATMATLMHRTTHSYMETDR